jgi:hypothetical protein
LDHLVHRLQHLSAHALLDAGRDDLGQVGELQALLAFAGVVSGVDSGGVASESPGHGGEEGCGSGGELPDGNALGADHRGAVHEAGEHHVHAGEHRQVIERRHAGVGPEVAALPSPIEQ